MAFCIPLFNQEKHIPLIIRNIKLIFRILPESVFFFNDNHSSDRTYERLLLIRKKWPKNVYIFRQSSNIGFSKNLSHFGEVSNYLKEKSQAEYFQLLGANDVITKKGLLHLREQIESCKKADLIISNWIYTEKREGKIKVLGDFDVSKRKIYLTLEEFFFNKLYIPGGIMQYCIHKDKLNELKNFNNEISPHVGVFFSSFPGRIICASSPGLCQVSKTESSGWRSSPCSVFKMLIRCFELYICFIKKAFKEKKITRKTCNRLIKEYTRLSWLVLKECREGQWGVWAPTRREILCISFLLLKGLLQGSLFQGLANLRYLQKNILKKQA